MTIVYLEDQDLDQRCGMIRKLVGDRIYLQLGEECSELDQACHKMFRVYDGINPTPKTENEVKANLIEEFTDVLFVAAILGLQPDMEQVQAKCQRWVDRLGITP